MTAYSFKPRFVKPIEAGLGITFNVPIIEGYTGDGRPVFGTQPQDVRPKRQTIRADRKRHARPGEELQLYCGMRTKGCFLIGRARCVSISTIRIRFACPGRPRTQVAFNIGTPFAKARYIVGRGLDYFARQDGFSNWQEMRAFWATEHPSVNDFYGVIILWEPLPGG